MSEPCDFPFWDHDITPPAELPDMPKGSARLSLESGTATCRYDPSEFVVTVTTEQIQQLVRDGVLVPDDPEQFENAIKQVEASDR